MKLSEINPADVEVIEQPAPSSTGLRLSDLKPGDYEIEAAPDKAPAVGQGEAVLRGGAQGLTMGYGDELTGLIESALTEKSYTQSRDEARANNAAAQEQNPWTYGAGNVAGGLATMAVPGLNLAKGATAWQAAKFGAATGAFAGLGSSNADLTKGDVGGAVADTATGALIGGAVSGAVGSISPVRKYLQEKAARSAETAVGIHLRPTAGVKRVLGPEKLRAAYREVLDSKTLGVGQKADDTALQLTDRLDEVGAAKGDILDSHGVTINPVEVAQRFENEVIAPLRKYSANNSIVEGLEKQKAEFLAKHAPGYVAGGRAPGTPTTLTRKSIHPQTDSEFSKVIAGEPPPPVGTLNKIGTRHVDTPVNPEEAFFPTPEDGGLTTTQRQVNFPSGLDSRDVPVTSYTMDDGQLSPSAFRPKQIIEKRIEATPPTPQIPASVLEGEKMATQGNINYLADPKAKQAAQMGWASVQKTGVENSLDDTVFNQSKNIYHNLANAQLMASKTGALQNGGLMNHIVDTGVGMEAVEDLLHGSTKGLGLGIARMVTKGRVASTVAVGLDKLSKILESSPEMFGSYAPALQKAAERGGNSLAVHSYLQAQRDPKYREMLENIQKQQPK